MKSLLYTVILLVITGCGYSSSQQRTFEEAERLMHTDPQAALSRLNRYDVSEFDDSATMAQWALLYSEALVANRLKAPTDTIVDIAIDYYGNHNLTDQFQKASRLKALIRCGDRTDELATALYLQREKEFIIYKERTARRQTLFVALAILLVAIGFIIWMRQRMKLQQARNEMLMAEASGLKAQVDAGRDNVSRLETRLRGLLGTRFALIDDLCQTYYETQGTKAEKKAIVEKVKGEIEGVRTDSSAQMEQAVNDCCDNILIKIRQEFPQMKPDDYRLFVYFACGLSARTVSLLVGETIDVVYKRKSRLKLRLREADTPVCRQILEMF